MTEAQNEILHVSAKWAEAIVSNDADRIAEFMADDWIMVSERGVSTKEYFLSFVRSGQLTHSAMDLAELGDIKIYDTAAIIVARVTNTAHFGGEAFEANEWTSDTFIRINGEWKCVLTHITPALAAK